MTKAWIDYDEEYPVYFARKRKPRWGGVKVEMDDKLFERFKAAEKEWRSVQRLMRKLEEDAVAKLPRQMAVYGGGLMASSGVCATTMLFSPSVMARSSTCVPPMPVPTMIVTDLG